MNKKVQNYLETNENEAFTEFKAFKNGATQIIAVGLTSAALIALLAGCNTQKTPKVTTDEPSITTNQVITDNTTTTTETPVSTDPIAENVTAEEVLQKIDSVLKAYMATEYNMSDSNPQFDYIGNHNLSNYLVSPYIIRFEDAFIKKKSNPINIPVYALSIHLNILYEGENTPIHTPIFIPSDIFEPYMQQKGIEPTIATQEMIDNYDTQYLRFTFAPGQQLYDCDLNISADSIKNASQTELNLLNQMVDIIESELINNKLPDIYDNELER